MQYKLDSVLLPRERIKQRIAQMAEQINKDYAGKTLMMIGILKGAVPFFAELLSQITLDVHIDFMAVSSYGASTKSSGVVRILKDLDQGIEDIDVLVVEDIVDSGKSMRYLLDSLQGRKPASIKLCTLLDKPDRRVAEVLADYVGFVIPDEFVVGFGLDYAEKYRNLPDICILKPDEG